MAFPARALPRTLSPKVLQPHALRLRQWQCRQLATAATATEYRDPEPFVPEAQQTPQSSRRASIRQAKPFSEFLTDNFDRQHDYLRISLTERCNLRCTYCMPEEGIQLSPNKDILTTPEIHYISALFVNQGVNKIRLTGGEPTVRKDILPLMHQIGSLRSNGLKELALTTNGISLHRKLDEMVAAGLTGVNISLDTLDPFQFQLLTRRQGFSAVMNSIERVKEMNKLGAKIKLKINCVMMRGLNDHQLLPFVEMTQSEDLEVRFIEYMPFGGNKWNKKKMMSYEDMLDAIRAKHPDIARLKDARNDTSKTWQVPGFAGRVGFITSMTHNFCGSCNRLRITSDGNLKVCLHGETEVSLRDLLRKDHGGEPMDEEAFEAVRKLELDRRSNPGLRFDGEEGWMSKEQQLLDVIGAAVKRKKAKHAGIGQLENMKNRPMILIGG
jgi:cyclic pyranopterin phosphate synthase